MKNGRWLFLAVLAVAIGCGGGGGSSDGGVIGGGGGSTNPSVSFSPDEPSPGSDTVSLGQQSLSGNSATLNVNVTGTNNIYGAAFDLTYDPAMVEFVSWSKGTLLETGGHSVSYLVDLPVSGRLVLSASRTGSAPEVDVSGTKPLIRLTFRATTAGTGPIAFENAALLDSQPQDLPGLFWAGGSLSAN